MDFLDPFHLHVGGLLVKDVFHEDLVDVLRPLFYPLECFSKQPLEEIRDGRVRCLVTGTWLSNHKEADELEIVESLYASIKQHIPALA